MSQSQAALVDTQFDSPEAVEAASAGDHYIADRALSVTLTAISNLIVWLTIPFLLNIAPAFAVLGAAFLNGVSAPLYRLRGGIAPLVVATSLVALPALSRLDELRREWRMPGPMGIRPRSSISTWTASRRSMTPVAMILATRC